MDEGNVALDNGPLRLYSDKEAIEDGPDSVSVHDGNRASEST
jgi:hypothetical protein